MGTDRPILFNIRVSKVAVLKFDRSKMRTPSDTPDLDVPPAGILQPQNGHPCFNATQILLCASAPLRDNPSASALKLIVWRGVEASRWCWHEEFLADGSLGQKRLGDELVGISC